MGGFVGGAALIQFWGYWCYFIEKDGEFGKVILNERIKPLQNFFAKLCALCVFAVGLKVLQTANDGFCDSLYLWVGLMAQYC